MAGAVDKGQVTPESVRDASVFKDVWVRRSSRGVEASLLGELVALVDLGVGIAQLNGDVSLQLVLETHSLHSGDGLDDCGLAVRDVSNRSNIDGGLAGNLTWKELKV